MKTKDSKELTYIGIAAMLIGSLMTLLELYYTCYSLVCALHINVSLLDSYLAAHSSQWSFLGANIWLRLYIVAGWLVLIFYPTHAERNGSVWRHLVRLLVLCAAFWTLRFVYLIMPDNLAQVANIAGTLALVVPILRRLMVIARYLSLSSASLSDNEKNADGFAQTQQLITNKNSVNLKYEYSHGGKLHVGYANFVNPFRGTITLGTPGSGKTYVSLEEFLRQFIARGFAVVLYDYKDPALSRLAYCYLHDYHLTTGSTKPRWGYISFKDLNRTYRSNPMKNITTGEDASDFAEVLLLALNRNMANQQGEFFPESAKNYTAVAIFVLGVLLNGKYQSLPHVLALVGSKLTDLLPIYAMLSVFYPQLRTITNTFTEAFEQGATEQLQGQVASARIGLARMNNPLLCYVMTEDKEHPEQNISLDANNKENPAVLCIGNDPEKDIILGLASSVYLSRLAKTINKKGTPTLFGIDELPTTYIKGLDNLIATARSNKIAVSLGFQDYTQLIRDYTQKVADAIINTCGNLISGSVKGETARKLSESFGEKKVLKQSKTVNHEGEVSVSYSEQRERKLPQDVIEELSQGEFVGRVMDERTQRIKHKVFHGHFIINAAGKINEDNDTYRDIPRPEIPKLRNLNEREQISATAHAQKEVMDEVQLFLNEAGEVAKKYEKLFKEWTKRVPQKRGDSRPESEAQPVCLERFTDDPDNPEEQKQFAIWLEMAYMIINDFATLRPVNDPFNDEEKFDMLLSNIFNAGMDKVKIVKICRQNLKLMTMESVQAYNEQQSA